jgi:hypothetical protein
VDRHTGSVGGSGMGSRWMAATCWRICLLADRWCFDGG